MRNYDWPNEGTSFFKILHEYENRIVPKGTNILGYIGPYSHNSGRGHKTLNKDIIIGKDCALYHNSSYVCVIWNKEKKIYFVVLKDKIK